MAGATSNIGRFLLSEWRLAGLKCLFGYRKKYTECSQNTEYHVNNHLMLDHVLVLAICITIKAKITQQFCFQVSHVMDHSIFHI